MCLRYYTFPDVSRMRLFRNRFDRSVGRSALQGWAVEIGRRNSEPLLTPPPSSHFITIIAIGTSSPYYDINTDGCAADEDDKRMRYVLDSINITIPILYVFCILY